MFGQFMLSLHRALYYVITNISSTQFYVVHHMLRPFKTSHLIQHNDADVLCRHAVSRQAITFLVS